jgi:hypothetical protein
MNRQRENSPVRAMYDMDSIRNAELIFIGGYSRSGPILIRSLLDSAFDTRVNCRPDEHIFAKFLQLQQAQTQGREKAIREAGLTEAKVFKFQKRQEASILKFYYIIKINFLCFIK